MWVIWLCRYFGSQESKVIFSNIFFLPYSGETTSSSPNMISLISDDNLLEILSRLPLHALLRLNKVSESFRKLTAEAFWLRTKISASSSSFIVHNYHQERNDVVHPGSSSNDTAATATADNALLPPSEDPRHHELLATCNGLLLYKDMAASDGGHRREIYRVSNPVTQQWFRLPPNTRKGGSRTVCIDFDPQISPHFKVAQIIPPGPPMSSLRVDIFHSQSEAWCEVDVDLPVSIQFVRSAVLVDNVLYACYGYGILRVDIRERSCLPIELPICANAVLRAALHKCKGRRVRYYGVSREGLAMWILRRESRWVPMFRCTFGFLHEQVCKRLPDGERFPMYGYWTTFGIGDLFPSSHAFSFSVLFRQKRTVMTATYDFGTKTVSNVSLTKVLGDRTFAF